MALDSLPTATAAASQSVKARHEAFCGQGNRSCMASDLGFGDVWGLGFSLL